VFVYLTGHGGNEFLKFQDNEEISAFDIADAFEQMWQKKRWDFNVLIPSDVVFSSI
jgi:GPI-anchor transamidase subunit K